MLNMAKYQVEFLRNPDAIYSKLHHGINLPIKDEFKKYIIWEIEHMNIESILLRDSEGQIIGHSCIYECESELYFGFFKVAEDNPNIIEELIEIIKKEAQNRSCESIKGPINLPQIIYGYGFSKPNCSQEISAGTPYTDPIYLESFKRNGFKTWHEILWYKIEIRRNPMKKIWPANTADFNDLSWMAPFIDIQRRNFPPSAKLTPGRTFEDYKMNLDLLEKYGYEDFIEMSYDGDRMIGVGYVLPNPFDLNETGKCRSLILMGAAIEPEYQNKKVLSSMILPFFNKCADWGITHGEWLVGADNKPSIAAARAFGGKVSRSYEILEFDV